MGVKKNNETDRSTDVLFFPMRGKDISHSCFIAHTLYCALLTFLPTYVLQFYW